MGGLTVHHPRYFLLPKISMPLHGVLMFLGCLRLALRLEKRLKPDCIDAHFVFPDGFAAVLLGRLFGIPVFVSARGTDINVYPTLRLIRPMIRWALRNAAGVVAVSEALRDAIVKVGLPRERVQVIGNGIDVARFKPIDRGEARHRLGLPARGMLIVSVGALIPSKGHDLLIRAFGQLAGRNPEFALYIIGEGTCRRELEKRIRETGQQGRVHLVGTRPNEELCLWFSAANVSCLASSREGWPNVITESLACGTPVVATPVGGVPEILASPDFGVVVDRTVQAIAAGLESALQKEWEREKLARYAGQRNWEAVAAEVEEWLASGISGNQAARNNSPPEAVHKEPAIHAK